MKIAFAGTPEFAASALSALYEAAPREGWQVPLVLTQPDRPAGRGMKLQMSAVKQAARSHPAQNSAVLQPRSLRLDGKYPEDAALARAALEALQPDVMIVAAYGLLLPAWTLSLPRLGCLNIHASLLPRWRGAAPIHRAIEAGDTQTGITIMQMDAGLDTGDMLLTKAVPISPSDTTSSLHETLAALGATMLIQALQTLKTGPLTRSVQPLEGITYAHKIDKAEAALDFHQSAAQLANKARAFDPFPGATGTLKGETIKLWQCSATADASGAAGKVLRADAKGLLIGCGEGALLVTELQRAGGKRLAVETFLQGLPIAVGAQFDLAA